MARKTVTTRGHRIAYEVVGEGPAVVLLHGHMMWGDFWRRRGYTEVLAADFTVVVPDLLGHGASDKPDDPAVYGIGEIADDVVHILDDAGVARAHVWGYSYGGWIAEAVALRHPERVVSLTMGGAVPGMAGEVRGLWSPGVIEAVEAGSWEPLVAGFGADIREQVAADNDLAAIGAHAPRWPEWTTTPEELAATGVPTLVYAGDDEWIHDSARAAAAQAGAAFKTMSGNHATVFGNPTQVLGAVRPHLDASADATRSP